MFSNACAYNKRNFNSPWGFMGEETATLSALTRNVIPPLLQGNVPTFCDPTCTRQFHSITVHDTVRGGEGEGKRERTWGRELRNEVRWTEGEHWRDAMCDSSVFSAITNHEWKSTMPYPLVALGWGWAWAGEDNGGPYDEATQTRTVRLSRRHFWQINLDEYPIYMCWKFE